MILPIRLRQLCLGAAVLGAAFGGPSADERALAAAAGSAFEAAPFVLAAALLGRLAGRHAHLGAALAFATLGGCGCTRGRIPGALALAAIVLAALTFGPAVAAARTVAALALLTRRGGTPRAGAGHENDDPLRVLERVAAGAFSASLAAAATAAAAAYAPRPLLFIAGLAIGAIAPCAVAGVAMAGAFAHAAPAVAAGALCTAGLVSLPSGSPAGRSDAARASVTTGFAALAAALGALAILGPSGLVSPRLLPLYAPAALVAAALAGTRTARSASAWPLAVPALLIFALVRPAPVAPPRAEATRLDDAFAGERLAFTGVAQRTGARTTLVREAITCCRLDAAPIAVRLDRALPLRDGTWVDARGTLARDAAGALVLHAALARAVAPPADPFVYR